MVVNDLKCELENTYELICFEDISNIISNQQSIYQLLEKHHREEFTPTQRLVLYSSYEPSQNVLNHIQRALASVDIGNYFVLIVTPFDIKHKIALAQSIHKQNDAPIESIVVDISDAKQLTGNIADLNTICAFPFMQMSVDQTGNIMPCCKYKQSIGNLTNISLADAFNSEKMVSLRKALASGSKVSDCDNCWTIEQSNSTSLRTHGIHKHISELDYGLFDNPQLKSVISSPSIVCNFKCRICASDTSSAIAVEELKYATDPTEIQTLKKRIKIKNSDFNDVILDGIIGSLDTVEYLHILGGEPFMWPGLKTVLSHAVQRDYAKNINIEFNTNGSIYPITLIDDLIKFKKVEILLSIDDIGERFELQRGGKWDDVLTNIKSFVKLQSPNVVVKLIATVNIQNILYLDQLVNFCNDTGLEIVWWYLETPYELSIDRVTQKVKDLVFSKYHNHTDSELRAIAGRMRTTAPVDGLPFLIYMSKLDNRRNQNFQAAHKEIYDAMTD